MPTCSVVNLRVSPLLGGCSFGERFFPEFCQNTVLLPESINIEWQSINYAFGATNVVSPVFFIQSIFLVNEINITLVIKLTNYSWIL